VIKPKIKIFILLTDGVGLRNFAYTSFYHLGIKKGYEIVFWNATPFDLNRLDISSVVIKKPKLHWYTDILKSACKKIELKLFAHRENDSIYYEYDFPLQKKSIKKLLKSALIVLYSKLYASEKGMLKIRNKIIKNEKKTSYYKDCIRDLKLENPDFVFSTTQRSGIAIAALEAAKKLGISTASFIFSWDNIPKATTVVNSNFYFVWSDHMKKELLHYQRYIKPEQVKVTGTPQFENHYDKSLQQAKKTFFESYGLDLGKKYICFSGDDITTSPKDELYLRDVAKAVRSLNEKEHNLGIIFRRCPVDFSNRYDEILEMYKDVIVSLDPIWEILGNVWNGILPTKEDLKLQTNIIAHTECVVNLGSSMVFDYVSHNKPCAYINYNYLNPSIEAEKGVYVYDYVHFRSMPSQEAVIWFSHPDNIANQLEHMLANKDKTVSKAKEWFEVINGHSPADASKRILEHINNLL
jgi:hypothetical protein